MPTKKTITITTYQFNELSDEAKQKAIEDNYRINLHWDWYDSVFESWKQLLTSIGFTNADIRFSGFHSQGDGASFTSDVDIVTLVKFLLDESDNCDVQWLKIDKPSFNQHFLSWFLSSNTMQNEIEFVVERKAHSPFCHYSHANTCYVECQVSNYADRESFANYLNELESDIETIRHELSLCIYQALKNEHEHRLSDEVIEESIEANEYQFDVDGELL